MSRRKLLLSGTVAGLVAALPPLWSGGYGAVSIIDGRGRACGESEARPAGRPAMHTWDAYQVGLFLDAIEGHRLHPLYHLAAYTGMRRGELCGLSWDDVNLDARRITVRWQITGGQRGCHRSRPKTVGVRVVHVDETAVEVLRTCRDQQARERTDRMPAYACATSTARCALVFTREDGATLDPRSVSRQFTMLAGQAGLGRRTLHGLREFATSGQTRRQS